MADTTIVLETHIYSNCPNGLPPWVRSFHLRLPSTGTKADILKLIRDSMARLGRADPIVEAQITLYWTRHGRVVSIPSTSNPDPMVTLPLFQPPQLVNYNFGFPIAIPQPAHMPMSPEYPLAMTYSGGANYLHSYGPNPAMMQPTIIPAHQTWIIGGNSGYINVPVFGAGGGGVGGPPIVSDVVREARLDGLADEGLTGMLEWAMGPNGLKLIIIVDANGRYIAPGVVGSSAAPVVPATPPTSAA